MMFLPPTDLILSPLIFTVSPSTTNVLRGPATTTMVTLWKGIIQLKNKETKKTWLYV